MFVQTEVYDKRIQIAEPIERTDGFETDEHKER
jgi:hypothetical protein